jgi:hypothetical protein
MKDDGEKWSGFSELGCLNQPAQQIGAVESSKPRLSV